MSPALTNQSPVLFDSYLGFDYKKIIQGRYNYGLQWLAPTWTGEHRRRLQAYALLQGYRDNASRMFMDLLSEEDIKYRDARREYGDASLFIEQIRSSLLGDQQTVAVTDADKFDPNDENVDSKFKAAAERQDFLRQWAEDERLVTKLVETERNAVTYGDGVYTLSWDPKRKRPVLLTWDPGTYFPVLDDVAPGEYPKKIHFAWELPKDQAEKLYGVGKIVIHRITYELKDVEPYSVPWDTEKATVRCFMTEAEWAVNAKMRTPDDLTSENANYLEDENGAPIDEKDLGIDFIPVIHIPNTVAENDHFGQSGIVKGLQIFDDLQSADSDLQSAAALTGGPMLAISGSLGSEQVTVGPNKALKMGDNGKAEMLSGAEGLTALADYRDQLLQRAETNMRVPAAVLGRVDPSKVNAGVILSLTFGPMASLVGEMRLIRDDKNRILLRFTQRMFMLDGQIDGEILDAKILYGSYLPTDRTGTVNDVAAAYGAKLISRATAIRMLQEVGFPIEDIGEEEKAIDALDFTAATELFDATGDEQLVGDFLGVKIAPKPPPPPVVVAPPNQPPQQPPGPQKPPVE
jgi:hypothetical protein